MGLARQARSDMARVAVRATMLANERTRREPEGRRAQCAPENERA